MVVVIISVANLNDLDSIDNTPDPTGQEEWSSEELEESVENSWAWVVSEASVNHCSKTWHDQDVKQEGYNSHVLGNRVKGFVRAAHFESNLYYTIISLNLI